MNFNEKVWNITKRIPKGKVTTYKEIAKALNSKAYKAVGNALNKNPHSNVPCHRVISTSGHLQGFAKGLKQKAILLKKEGIEIKNNRINLKKYFFKLH